MKRTSGFLSFRDLCPSWSAASCGTPACESTGGLTGRGCGAQIKCSGNQASPPLSSSDKQITSAFINRGREKQQQRRTAHRCSGRLHRNSFTGYVFPPPARLYPCYILKSSSKFPEHRSFSVQHYNNIWTTVIVPRPL